MNMKEIKTDPKLRFSLLKRSEEDILGKLAETEKQLKIFLAQLEATRNLLNQAANEIQEETFERTKTQQEKEQEEVDALEEVVAKSRDAIDKSNNKEQFSTYTSITGQRLTTATSYDSLKRLTELAYASNEWSDEESKEFFQIREALHQVRGYDLSEPLQETVEQTYQIIQLVEEKKPEQIALNYDATYAIQRPLNLNQTIQNMNQENKSQEEIKPIEQIDIKQYVPNKTTIGKVDFKKKEQKDLF